MASGRGAAVGGHRRIEVWPSGLGSLLFGVLHGITGGWYAPFGLLLAALVVLGIGAFEACRPRMLEDT